MNDAVYKFKRYEDSSLSYTGIDKHKGMAVGGYDTVLTREEFEKLFGAQQSSILDFTQKLADLSEVGLEDTDNDEYEYNDIEDTPASIPTFNKPVKTLQPVEPARTMVTIKHPVTAVKDPASKIALPPVNVGMKVSHKMFGVGIVSKLGDGHVTVAFGKAEKMFMFPGAFESGFLHLEN